MARLVGGVDCSPAAVCGCDGRTYSNGCVAAQNGTDTAANASCIPGNGGLGAACAAYTDCKTGFKCCGANATRSSPIACEVPIGGQCPAIP